MASSTLSFNKFWIISAIVLVLIVEFISYSAYPIALKGINHDLQDQINQEKPNIILIGSSPLWLAVSKDRLENDLKSLLNRRCKVLISSKGQTGAAYWQLLLKNQVAQSKYKGFTVGLVVKEGDLTGQDQIFDTDGLRGKKILSQLNYYEQPLYYRKGLEDLRGSPVEMILHRVRFVVVRRMISSDLLNAFVSNILNHIIPTMKVDDILNERFNPDKFKNGLAYHQAGSNKYDFDGTLKESFLPDIIALKKDYNIKLFVVVLPTLEASSEAKKRYFGKLRDYLERNGVPYISFWDNKCFNDDALFFDEDHLYLGSRINEMLAKELVDRGLVVK